MLEKLYYKRAATIAATAEREKHYRKAIGAWHKAQDQATTKNQRDWCNARISMCHRLSKRDAAANKQGEK